MFEHERAERAREDSINELKKINNSLSAIYDVLLEIAENLRDINRYK